MKKIRLKKNVKNCKIRLDSYIVWKFNERIIILLKNTKMNNDRMRIR